MNIHTFINKTYEYHIASLFKDLDIKFCVEQYGIICVINSLFRSIYHILPNIKNINKFSLVCCILFYNTEIIEDIVNFFYYIYIFILHLQYNYTYGKTSIYGFSYNVVSMILVAFRVYSMYLIHIDNIHFFEYIIHIKQEFIKGLSLRMFGKNKSPDLNNSNGGNGLGGSGGSNGPDNHNGPFPQKADHNPEKQREDKKAKAR